MKSLRNYIFILLTGTYFIYFLSGKWTYIFNNIEESVKYWNYILSYFNAIIWLFLSINLISLFQKYIEKILTKIFSMTENKLDDILLEFIVKFISIVKYLASIYIGIYLAIIPNFIEKAINNLLWVSILIIFLIILTSFINAIFEKELILKSKMKNLSRTFFPFINKIIVIFIWIIWAIAIIWNLGYDVSALIAWAWIGWLAIALAAQKSITNIFWAITIILNKPFKVWDFVNINWHEWIVKDIWLSYLTITDRMWHQVMIPNETIISTSIDNYSIRENRRVDFSIWVVYGTSLKQMEKWVTIIEAILEEYVKNETIKNYRVNFDMFWDFSLNINTTYFSLLKNYKESLKQKEEINLKIKEKFEKAKIDMAFPTQELIIKK